MRHHLIMHISGRWRMAPPAVRYDCVAGAMNRFRSALLLGLSVACLGCTWNGRADDGLVRVPGASQAVRGPDGSLVVGRRGDVVVVNGDEQTVVARGEFVQDMGCCTIW